MIYDSVRQSKPTIRNNFGVGRFNTRLNFYFFAIYRLSFLQKKNFYNYRFKSTNRFNKEDSKSLSYTKLIEADTSLYNYQFIKK